MPDIGLQVINALFRSLKVNRRWLHTIERGFRWWPGPLAQTCWAEPCFKDDGLSITRLHVRTDFLRDVPTEPAQLSRLGLLMQHATLSGLVQDPDRPGRFQLAASLYVHEQTRPWLSQVAALAGACQAAEAHVMADEMARLLGGRPDRSAHPTSGPRPSLDPITEALAQHVAPDGRRPSRFAGAGMLAALEWLEQTPFISNGTEDRLTSEFPFGARTSLLRVDAAESNPRVGNGLFMLLTLPAGETDPADPQGTQYALELNRRELTELTRTHFLGSWCPSDAGLSFVTFYPNAFGAISPGCTTTLVQAAALRARWAASVFNQSFDPQRASAGKVAMMEQLRQLSEEELREIVANLPEGQAPERTLQALLAMKRVLEGGGES